MRGWISFHKWKKSTKPQEQDSLKYWNFELKRKNYCWKREIREKRKKSSGDRRSLIGPICQFVASTKQATRFQPRILPFRILERNESKSHLQGEIRDSPRFVKNQVSIEPSIRSPIYLFTTNLIPAWRVSGYFLKFETLFNVFKYFDNVV